MPRLQVFGIGLSKIHLFSWCSCIGIRMDIAKLCSALGPLACNKPSSHLFVFRGEGAARSGPGPHAYEPWAWLAQARLNSVELLCHVNVIVLGSD